MEKKIIRESIKEYCLRTGEFKHNVRKWCQQEFLNAQIEKGRWYIYSTLEDIKNDEFEIEEVQESQKIEIKNFNGHNISTSEIFEDQIYLDWSDDLENDIQRFQNLLEEEIIEGEEMEELEEYEEFIVSTRVPCIHSQETGLTSLMMTTIIMLVLIVEITFKII